MRCEQITEFITEIEKLPAEERALLAHHVSLLRERLPALEAAPVSDDGKVSAEWIAALWPVVEAMDDALAVLAEHRR
jgi:hypothetical protein